MKQQQPDVPPKEPPISELARRLDPGPYDDRWDDLFRSRLATVRRSLGRRPAAPDRSAVVWLRAAAAPLAAAAAVALAGVAVWRATRPAQTLLFSHPASLAAALGSPEPAFCRERWVSGRTVQAGASVERLHRDRTFDLAFHPGATFRIDSRRRGESGVQVDLGKGTLWGFTLDRFTGGQQIQITAGGWCEIVVTGTRWMAQHQLASGEISLAVFEGAVGVRSAENEWTVPAGAMVILRPGGGRPEMTPVPVALLRQSWLEWHKGLLLDGQTFHVQLALPDEADRLATLRSVPFLIVGRGGSARWRHTAIQAAMVGLAADSLADAPQRLVAHAQAAAEIAGLAGARDLPLAARPALALFAAAHQRLAGNPAEAARWTAVARAAAAELGDPAHAALALAFEVSVQAERGQLAAASSGLAELRSRFPESPEAVALAGTR